MEKQVAIKKVLEYCNQIYGEGKVEYICDFKAGVIEKEELWYVPFKGKRENEGFRWLGSQKACIIRKENGEIYCIDGFFSSNPNDEIWGYRLGLRETGTDLIINKVHDREKTIEVLQIILDYVIPEYESGEVWKIHKSFSQEEIEKRISTLPCKFENQFLTKYLGRLKHIADERVFEFELKPATYKYKDIKGELIDKFNLINRL